MEQTVIPISTRENAVTLCMKMHETIYPCFLKVLDSNKVNCSDGNGNTLLHMAVQTLQPDLCETLINCGANVEAINKQGNSPIFELFIHSENRLGENNIKKILKISKIFIDSRAFSEVIGFENPSQCNSQRLMLYLLSKHPNLKIVTENDFKLAFSYSLLDNSKKLIDIISEESFKVFLSTEIFYSSMKHADPNLLKSLFDKASSDVQQSIIEDLLRHFADNDEYDAFINLLETKIVEPKLLFNGETLFTGLLKDKNVKYCLAIIHHAVGSKYLNLANVSNQMPLQIAIETELYDFLWPLIFRCDQLNNEDIDWNTPLLQLFKKLSISSDVNMNQKLVAALNEITSRGDIYKESSPGIKTIEPSSLFPLRIKFDASLNTERNIDFQIQENNNFKQICNKCRCKESDCVFECCHTFCLTCSLRLLICPVCNVESTNPKYLTKKR